MFFLLFLLDDRRIGTDPIGPKSMPGSLDVIVNE
jgi:hypothetical protein